MGLAPMYESEAERQKREAERQKREDAQEAKRIAVEQERRAARDRAAVEEQWAAFQKVKHNAPPTLLPLEALGELEAFRTFLEKRADLGLIPSAVAGFKAEIVSQGREGQRAVQRLQTGLQSVSPFAGLFRGVSFWRLSELLRRCVVSVLVPDLGSPAREAITEKCRLLRKTWGKVLAPKEQAMFSIYRSAGKSVIHIGSSIYGSAFITLPPSLEPADLSEPLLSQIRHAALKFIPKDSTVAVIDGDQQALNYQRIFPKNGVVRTFKDDCDRFVLNLDSLLEREAPTVQNTALHFGMPANESELKVVFPSDPPDWTLWRDVAPLWQNRAARHGFDQQPPASAQQVINSLTTEKNVIVVIAHAHERTVFMPAPPPEGSKLSADQIIEHKSEITANRPVVYLFCCETAQVSDLKSFSEILLDSGAAAVVAPQSRIRAERSVNFFEGIVQGGSTRPQNSLAKIKAAEQRSNYREMEVWVG